MSAAPVSATALLERVGKAIRRDARLDPVGSLQRFVTASSEYGEANYHGGPRPGPVRGLGWHATAGDTADGAMGWLDRVLKRGEGKASYNYLIDRDTAAGGSMRIVRFLDPSVVAYHAGRSSWPTIPGRWGSLNTTTIGIAWANDNGSDGNLDDDPLTDFQLCAGLWLAAVLCERYKLDPRAHMVGHREMSPGRKTDPLPRVIDMSAFREATAVVLTRRVHRRRAERAAA